VSRSNSGRIVRVCTTLAVIHSVLASKQAKDVVRRIAGPRYRNGLYRFSYVVKSFVMFGWATIWFLRLPDRQLYHVRAPWSWLMQLVQFALIVMLFRGIRVIGILRFIGLPQLWALLAGGYPEPEPEAQGPPLGSQGDLVIAGPFRYTRHPDNLPVFLLWLFPKMTVNRATVAALTSIYAI
jgi:protein-S-isoprenylcysteine O-methyltransferase Ste14